MRRDSQYTDPDVLRLLYLNPRNPLGSLGDQDPLPTATVEPPAPPVPPTGGGGGCPALGQYTIKYISSTRERFTYTLVQALRPKVDYLWNPITKNWNRVGEVELIENVPVVKVVTENGAAKIVSYSHPVIQKLDDADGTPAIELKERIDIGRVYGLKAVSCIGLDAVMTKLTEISEIPELPTATVVRIYLETEHIFPCGIVPGRMIMGHNKISIEDQLGNGGGPQ